MQYDYPGLRQLDFDTLYLRRQQKWKGSSLKRRESSQSVAIFYRMKWWSRCV
jgi:hypothetical protein